MIVGQEEAYITMPIANCCCNNRLICHKQAESAANFKVYSSVHVFSSKDVTWPLLTLPTYNFLVHLRFHECRMP